MNIIEIIQKKRDAKSLTKDEIVFFVNSYTTNQIPDYQASAFLMACFINGLSIKETAWLTQAMLHSGIVVDLSEIPGIKVDKHSTGGVGDKTSLIIAPICAAAGVPVPMISGRGLGHTGGTLDKLESIPGFNVNLSLNDYKKIVKEHNMCLIGQTKEIAPADKKIYSLRDVTSTVENKSLITASIMSKKLAEGIDALVFDVKVGCGAFMKTLKDAEELANLLISTAKQMDKKAVAIVSDMNQPLGTHIGNALEVIESVQVLKGTTTDLQKDLVELSIELAAYMILLGNKTKTIKDAKKLAIEKINNGSALQKFKALVSAQNGDASSLDDFAKLPQAKYKELIIARESGFISELNALLIGQGSVALGAGRNKKEDTVDPAVGIVLKKKLNDKVSSGEGIMEIHYSKKEQLNCALPFLNKAVNISKKQIKKAPLLIKKTIRS